MFFSQNYITEDFFLQRFGDSSRNLSRVCLRKLFYSNLLLILKLFYWITNILRFFFKFSSRISPNVLFPLKRWYDRRFFFHRDSQILSILFYSLCFSFEYYSKNFSWRYTISLGVPLGINKFSRAFWEIPVENSQ